MNKNIILEKKINPFIILPYGKRQSIVYYGNRYIGIDENIWRELIFGCNENGIRNNIKKVCIDELSRGNKIIIYRNRNFIYFFHIYPTECVESFSGRKGLFLIIGFHMEYKLLKMEFDKTISALDCFFSTISRCCADYMNAMDVSIPTRFVNKANVRAYHNYIQNCLTEADNRMQIILHKGNDSSQNNNKLYHIYKKIIELCKFDRIICVYNQNT